MFKACGRYNPVIKCLKLKKYNTVRYNSSALNLSPSTALININQAHLIYLFVSLSALNIFTERF